MRTTVDIDLALLRRLRNEAHRRGLPFKTLLGIVLKRGLEERTADRGPYVCPTFSMGAPPAGVNFDKALGLSATMEEEEVLRELSVRK